MDFFSEKELSAQTGHSRAEWPAVIAKELIDNALDACEEHDIAPELLLAADASGITVADNGPGLPESTISGVLDFTVRVSSREAYCGPTRGAQGNALKTLVGLPYVADPEHGRLIITTGGMHHSIACRLDQISQKAAFNVEKTKVSKTARNATFYKSGSAVRVEWRTRGGKSREVMWPFDTECTSASWRQQFLALARGYVLFNPHLSLTLDCFGKRIEHKATDPAWKKWKPHHPTSPHWYGPEHLGRQVGAYITHDRESGSDRTVAEFLHEFDGLTGSRKRTTVLEQANLKRAHLSEMASDRALRTEAVDRLLTAMKAHTKPVHPRRLGQIGEEHFRQRLLEFGCQPDSITYRVRKRCDEGVAFVLESAFGFQGGDQPRQLYAGANWSPGIKNPFRSFGTTGEGLESLLANQRAGRDEPIVFALHLAHPRVVYSDRGKSAIVVPE